MTAFFRFPRTPHIAWLGEGKPRDDKVLAPHEVQELLAHDLVVEEKADGASTAPCAPKTAGSISRSTMATASGSP